MNRRELELRQLATTELLRRVLAPQRAARRGRALPPEPSATDRALCARASAAERARVSGLLRRAGFTRAEVALGELHLQTVGIAGELPENDDGPADDVTRARARQLRRRG